MESNKINQHKASIDYCNNVKAKQYVFNSLAELFYGWLLFQISQPASACNSNMRVLLAKLSTSTRRIGLTLRGSVAVIPKSGYRYNAPQRRSAE